MSTEADLKAIQARWVLGLVSGEDLPTIATTLLSQGIESKALVELAGLSRTEAGAPGLFERALDELGCIAMEPTEALKHYAKAVSASILACETSPLDGAKRIWRATLYVGAHGFHDLDPFVYAASEAESRPQDRELFERAIIDEARRWHSAEF
jgi:hypothetical protein